jgi:hypothetical protein
MPVFARLYTSFKVAMVSGFLAWQRTGKMKVGDEAHFHFVFHYRPPPA